MSVKLSSRETILVLMVAFLLIFQMGRADIVNLETQLKTEESKSVSFPGPCLKVSQKQVSYQINKQLPKNDPACGKYICGGGEKCIKRSCVEKCAGVECKQSQTCFDGKCQSMLCGSKICPKGSYCKNGVCTPSDYICGEKKFWKAKLCNQDRSIYKNCPSSSQGPRNFEDQSYCGFTKDGEKSSFSANECSVCQNNEIKYYIQKQCPSAQIVCKNKIDSMLCLGVMCKTNQICVKGKCWSKNCKKNNCVSDEYCKDDKCVQRDWVCQQKNDFKVTICSQPRPTDTNCYDGPNLAPPGPPPNRCGITYDKTRRNIMPWVCDPCIDTQVAYYFDQPCYDAPFVCNAKQMCNGEYCAAAGCKKDSQCPYDWQICVNQFCIDSCEKKDCPNCKFGKCQYKPNPLGTCVWNPTPFNLLCLADKNLPCYSLDCIDDCQRHACPPEKKCYPHNQCAD